MKHIIKKWSGFRAGCKRPGCITSLEGGIVEDMTKKDLAEFFQGDCPGVFNPKKRHMSHKESVNYLLKYANKKIKAWQKLIDYWQGE